VRRGLDKNKNYEGSENAIANEKQRLFAAQDI
jgi:hypothetical protein